MSFSSIQRTNWQNTIGTQHRWNFSTGATRSGKTYIDYFKIPYRVRQIDDKGVILLLGNTQGSLERNILDPMRHIWGNGLVGRIGGASSRVRLFGHWAYGLGADKISSVAKIQGQGLSYCYGDEVTTWNPEVFTMLKSRLDKPGATFDGTCNPDSPKHWLKQFIDQPDIDVNAMRFRLDDNPYVDDEFKKNLKREYKGTIYYDRYIEGLWVAAEGIIYRPFADCPERYIIKQPPAHDEIAFCSVGVDFGGTGSAQAFQCTGITRHWNVVTLDEYYTKDPIDPQQLGEAFADFCAAQLAHKYPLSIAYADSAEPVLIHGLQGALYKRHIPMMVKPAKKGAINDRIRFYTILMNADKYRVMHHCKHTIDAFSTATWNPKVQGDERLDNGTYNIDSLDAQEYSTEPWQQQILQITLLGG